jgi:uncharacterized protein (TIGR03435 family)
MGEGTASDHDHLTGLVRVENARRICTSDVREAIMEPFAKGMVCTMARRGLSLLQSHGNLLLLAVGCVALGMPVFAQGTAPAPQGETAKTFAYEVVSVHPCKTSEGMSVSTLPNRISDRCITLWGLMYNAFNVRMSDLLPGLPGWANSDTFDVEAEMDNDTFAALQKLPREQQWPQRQRMLQAFLADRFKLAIHHETKEQPIYALVIAKGGPKLTPNEIQRGSNWSSGSGRLDVHGGPIASLAFALSNLVGRNVVDKTGLTGKYDMVLKWTPDEQQGTADSGPSLFTALQEQLGLKLEAQKGPVDTIVIDHVEKPSEN